MEGGPVPEPPARPEIAARIVRWDGTEWLPFGDPDDFPCTIGCGYVDAEPQAMVTLPRGELVIGGNFERAGGLLSYRNHLAAPACTDAADANDDGKIDLSDPVFSFSYLFLGGAAPPNPGPSPCGPDLTPDSFVECVYGVCAPSLR